MKLSNKRVIFVNNYPLQGRDIKRFGFEYWSKNNYRIEVWDISKYYYKNLSSIPELENNTRQFTTLKIVKIFQLLAESRKINKYDVIIICGTTNQINSFATLTILVLLSRTKGIFTNVLWGDHPLHNTEAPRNLKGKFRTLKDTKKLNILVLCRLANSVFWRRIRSINLSKLFILFNSPLKPFDFVWLGTLSERIPRILLGRMTELVHIHNLDFDEIIDIESLRPKMDKYIVFIDSMGPLHTDYLVEKRFPGITQIHYSLLLNKLLDRIESDLQMKLVIAAHPRSNSEICETLYGKRPCFFGKTPELIFNSSYVIAADGSTAIGFVAYWNKPLIILNSNSFDKSTQIANKAFRELLDPLYIDCDNSFESIKEFTANQRLYKKYVEKYIKKSGTPGTHFWEAVLDRITIL